MSDLVPQQHNFMLYQTVNGEVSVSVLLKDDTIWLSQEQMSKLFERERSVITKHIGNVFSEGELEEKSNVQILHISGSDRPVKLYNPFFEARKKRLKQKPDTQGNTQIKNNENSYSIRSNWINRKKSN